MIKLLIGGSPCTHWSIARTAGRETEPSGIGWELFKNYLIAKEKFKPDFATEIDKHAIEIAKSNYPDIVECGDAFAVREEEWNIKQFRERVKE